MSITRERFPPPPLLLPPLPPLPLRDAVLVVVVGATYSLGNRAGFLSDSVAERP